MTRDEYPHAERTQEVSWGLEILQEKNDKQLELVVVLSECCHKIRWNVEVNLTRNSAIFHRLFHDALKSVRRRGQDGDCVHYLMVSRVQRKPRIGLPPSSIYKMTSWVATSCEPCIRTSTRNCVGSEDGGWAKRWTVDNFLQNSDTWLKTRVDKSLSHR